MKSVLLAGLVVLAPACVDPGDADTEPVAALKNCPELVCGNAAEIDDQPFWELDETKMLYSPIGGFRITNFRQAGQELQLIVSGDELIGVPLLGGPPLQRSLLVGATIDIEKNGGGTYRLTITGYNLLHQFEDDAAPDIDIPAFQFKYTQLGMNRGLEFLCPAGGPSLFDRMAIVSQGDRYDSETGEVVATGAQAEPWFNIACSTSALWKMSEFRYTEATEDLAHPSDEASRTAVLRSIIADYCGIGLAFTVYGTDVDWANDIGSLHFNAGYGVNEALWDRDGAVCLTKPRKVSKAKVDEYCQLDPCGLSHVIGWTANYTIFTKVKP